jgi:hypothetical protein
VPLDAQTVGDVELAGCVPREQFFRFVVRTGAGQAGAGHV